MDDTPNKERVRLMHRSTSYLEFLPDGDRVDNTIGEKYDMVDSHINTHALGNSFTSINGFYDLYINGTAKTVSPSPNDNTSESGNDIGFLIANTDISLPNE